MARRKPKLPHLSFYKIAESNRWAIAFRVPGKKRVVKKLARSEAHSYARAQVISDLLDQHQAEILSLEDLERTLGDDTPVEKHIDRWESYLKTKSKSETHQKTTVGRVRAMCKTLGIVKLSHATPALLGQIPDRIGNKARQTIKHHQRAMSQFFNWCCKRGMLTTNPMAQLDTVRVKGFEVHSRRVPTDEEIQYFFQWLSPRPRRRPGDMSGAEYVLYFQILYTTGLRGGECASIMVPWLDLGNRLIIVPGDKTKNGKPGKIPLTHRMAERIRQYVGDRKAGKLFANISKRPGQYMEDWLDAARADWLALPENEVPEGGNVPLEAKRADFLKRKTDQGYFDVHAFRHAFINAMVQGGNISVKDAQTLARHSTAELTVGLYSRPSDQMLKGIEDTFGSV